MSQNKMLPGFELVIEDNQVAVDNTVPLKDVYTIYAILPELMQTKDSENNIEEVYIEPNKPLMVSDSNEAIKTLEISDMALTREVKNIISLIPNGSSIALVRIVRRDGEAPNPNSLVEMYEALDFAFESTENFPSKEIIVAGISLDDAVGLKPKIIEKTKVEKEYSDKLDYIDLVTSVENATGSIEVLKPRHSVLSLEVTKVAESATEAEGVFNCFEFKINGKTAKALKDGDETKLVDAKAVAVMKYTGDVGSKVASVQSVTTQMQANITKQDNTLTLTLTKDLKIKADDETVIVLKAGSIIAKLLKPTSSETSLVSKIEIRRAADNADILTRIMRHNAIITATQNNCMTFISPKPPKNNSSKAREEYVERCLNLQAAVRDRLSTIENQTKKDLGMFLTVPVGVNMVDGIGGVTGFPQARISTITDKTIITKKVSTAFSEGDVIEIYTHKKLEQLCFQTKVKSVSISGINTTQIVLEDSVPSEITSSTTPKYIMNVNNKDFHGTYLSRQWSNVCKEAGVNRSPAGLLFPGECQMRFSEKEVNNLDAKKFCVLQQEQGKNMGSVSRSQLMTSTLSQFQKVETLKTIYELVEKSKNVAMKYKGQRIDAGADLALIKTEIEDAAFKPAVDVFITPGYVLKLNLYNLTNGNGQKEKALKIDFTVKEIETLSLIRMTARLF